MTPGPSYLFSINQHYFEQGPEVFHEVFINDILEYYFTQRSQRSRNDRNAGNRGVRCVLFSWRALRENIHVNKSMLNANFGQPQ
ncbi:hypothetical protein L21SP5_00944 [Salinivirga cyanobacteriivorans]|uniref:Uncharacterized protein n=1 Tax=Salinivirga cyanobacteriivorans TaxID=1307839 RepID=A0A0S2HX19_9BACT|nr:hypothetical protein [Salinivirga cyanobacteriivorans]ALO14611.1 hypothetical protein L21SP5_00944 [Salinivirga cyanobacteriivorans]